MKTTARSFLESVLGRMRPQLLRSMGSLALIDRRQIACGLVDRDGMLLATDNPDRLGTLQSTSDAILTYFEDGLEVGDVVMTNDPYSGGTRIQDLTLLVPMESGGQRVGYAVLVSPLPDMGGMALGGNYPFALEIWAEGVRVTPTRLYRKGQREQDALTMLTLNSRLAELVVRDTEAMVSALARGAESFKTNAPSDLDSVIPASRTALAEALAKLPTKTAEGRSRPVHRCLDESALEVKARIGIEADGLRIDFAGSSPQSTGFVNSTAATTRAAAVASVVRSLGIDVLPNAGLLDCVEIDLPDDCFLNAKLPVSVGWSVYGPAQGIAEAVGAALGDPDAELPGPHLPFQTAGCGRPECPFSRHPTAGESG